MLSSRFNFGEQDKISKAYKQVCEGMDMPTLIGKKSTDIYRGTEPADFHDRDSVDTAVANYGKTVYPEFDMDAYNASTNSPAYQAQADYMHAHPSLKTSSERFPLAMQAAHDNLKKYADSKGVKLRTGEEARQFVRDRYDPEQFMDNQVRTYGRVSGLNMGDKGSANSRKILANIKNNTASKALYDIGNYVITSPDNAFDKKPGEKDNTYKTRMLFKAAGHLKPDTKRAIFDYFKGESKLSDIVLSDNYQTLNECFNGINEENEALDDIQVGKSNTEEIDPSTVKFNTVNTDKGTSDLSKATGSEETTQSPAPNNDAAANDVNTTTNDKGNAVPSAVTPTVTDNADTPKKDVSAAPSDMTVTAKDDTKTVTNTSDSITAKLDGMDEKTVMDLMAKDPSFAEELKKLSPEERAKYAEKMPNVFKDIPSENDKATANGKEEKHVNTPKEQQAEEERMKKEKEEKIVQQNKEASAAVGFDVANDADFAKNFENAETRDKIFANIDKPGCASAITKYITTENGKKWLFDQGGYDTLKKLGETHPDVKTMLDEGTISTLAQMREETQNAEVQKSMFGKTLSQGQLNWLEKNHPEEYKKYQESLKARDASFGDVVKGWLERNPEDAKNLVKQMGGNIGFRDIFGMIGNNPIGFLGILGAIGIPLLIISKLFS